MWPRVALHAIEVVQVASVGELVEVDHGLVMPLAIQSSTKLAPMKPAPPVTKIMGWAVLIRLQAKLAIIPSLAPACNGICQGAPLGTARLAAFLGTPLTHAPQPAVQWNVFVHQPPQEALRWQPKKFPFGPEDMASGAVPFSDAVKESAQQIWLAGLGRFPRRKPRAARCLRRWSREGVNIQRKTQTIGRKKSPKPPSA